jgi:hypothetical protein
MDPQSSQIPPPPRLRLDEHLEAEMAKISFQQALPHHLNEPKFGGLSTWNWMRDREPVLAWPTGSNAMWRKGVMATITQSEPAELQTVVLYPQPQYPTILSAIFPTWWMVMPAQATPSKALALVPPPRANPPHVQSFAEWLEETVRKDWSKVDQHLDQLDRGELIDSSLEAAVGLLPAGAARDGARKAVIGAVRFIAGMIKDNASDAVVEIIEERFLGGLADMYFENNPGTDPAVQRGVRTLLDALVNRVLEGQQWSPPGHGPSVPAPEFRGPIFAPDPGTSWAPPAQGSISQFAKIIIQGQLDPDFKVRKIIPKPFLGPF